MASWGWLPLEERELDDLRALLCQTNCHGSFQARLIERIDATKEELERDRFPRRRVHVARVPD